MKRLLISLVAVLATAATAMASSLVRPNDMGTGSLLFESNTPGLYVEAPRVDSDFDITVSGQIARTRITQRFENPANGWVEGVYVFPLPENAAVDTLKMVIGDRIVVGDIKEKQEAKQIYEKAKAAGLKAALLEQERPNIFTNQIANIGPRESIVIQIEYQQPVRLSSGVFSLRVPMVVAPRYSPLPALALSASAEGQEMYIVSDPVPDRANIEPPVLDPRKNPPVNPIAVAVHLKPGFDIGEVKSSYHDVVAAGEAQARDITLKNPEFADRDFELTWTAKPSQAPAVSVFAEKLADDQYALVQITPPSSEPQQKRLPREAIFVIDNSGSMAGPSMAQAKASLVYALDRLDAGDRFNVIRFDNTMERVFPRAVEASRQNIDYARNFVAALDADGGTEMLEPLRAALDDQNPGDASYLRQVVFLTDGAIGNEQQMFDLLGTQRGRSRVFMVGIGSAPNGFLMTRMAEIGRGSFTQIGEGGQVEERMRELFAKLENPAVTNLKVTASSASIEPTPSDLPDLYRGEPLTLLVKALELEGTLGISGTIGDRTWSETIALDKSVPGSGIGKLWARRMIDDAEVARSLGRIEQTAADARILSLALEHHLVSRVTSLVAVDKTPSRQQGEPLARADVPLNLPAGWDFDKVFGEQEPKPEREAMLDATMVASVKAAPAPAQAAAQPKQIDLPQTATPSQMLMIAGAMLIALALALQAAARRRGVA
ncbi:marine proteobacterial sortase target protein [Mesorhizobium sp. ASY16-5R]|uniref:marine proteobacterial sortase target protein n=1 Tax=Mesorhizobium sp. ASY16-5R TaxID=3445772 RepID=UPI003F9F4CC4